jgi:ABC-type glutathione transport system ATPase component
VQRVYEFLASHPFADETKDRYRRVLEQLIDLDLSQLTAAGLVAFVCRPEWGNSQRYVALCACRSFVRWLFGVSHPALTARVKRGKTIKVATLTQQLAELKDVWNDRVSDVIASQKSSYISGGKEMTPGQLLERVGFASAQLSTPVKDLSGGQKRRLQLLLILLSEPNVLILDEPTAAIDAKAEADIFAHFRQLTANRISIIISHRFSTVRIADHIIVLDRGKIIEQGDHDSLLALGGQYATLFELQAQGYM